MFELTLEPTRNLVVMRLTGFWSDTTIADFERALAAFVARLPRDKSLDWLIDSSEFAVQTQAVVERLGKARAGVGDYERRMAMVIPGMLSRMQATRQSAKEHFFKTSDEARAWLAEQA